MGKPEEVIMQFWLIKLTQEYQYPLDRIEVEKSVQFGVDETSPGMNQLNFEVTGNGNFVISNVEIDMPS